MTYRARRYSVSNFCNMKSTMAMYYDTIPSSMLSDLLFLRSRATLLTFFNIGPTQFNKSRDFLPPNFASLPNIFTEFDRFFAVSTPHSIP